MAERSIGVSYGCLVSNSIRGLMMEGRDIPVDEHIFGLTRIMGTCMGAGKAAGIAVRENVEPIISEGDCREGRYLVYEEKCCQMFTVLREELGLPEVPILVGGLGDFLVGFTKKEVSVNFMKVNEALQNVAKTLPKCGFVSASGLTANPEIIHFNAVSLREFGLRYYTKFRELEDRERVFQEKEDKVAKEVTGLEAL